MPLRPSLTAHHPRGPQPRAVRQVHCPGCGARLEISRLTMSLRCPHCTRHLRLEDVVLRKPLDGELTTQGHVHVTERSTMTGQLTCGELTVTGRYSGSIEAFGQVELQPRSHTTGRLAARSLIVRDGATLEAEVRIGNITMPAPIEDDLP